MLRFAEPHIYTPVDDSLVLWISGRGRGVGSKVFDLSKKGNHGIIYGATWVNTPIGHSALSFDGVDDYCFSEDTEVLTRQGWKKVSEVSYKDEIATLNPETDELEYQRPSKLFNFEYNGEMCHFYGRHLDLLVTPDHNVYVSRYKSGADWHPYRLEKAKDVLKDFIRFKKDCRWIGDRSNREAYAKGELIGYNGRVYGITVPKYHIIYVRRNGKACWAGNCDCGNDESLNITDAVTIEVWVNIRQFRSGHSTFLASNSWRFQTRYSDRDVLWEWTDGTTKQHVTTDVNVLPDLGNWVYVVGTKDTDGSTKLYVNGKLKKSGVITVSRDVTQVYIGRDGISGIGGTDWLNGFIDEARIYNRALSAEEIRERYNLTKHLYGY